MASGGAGLKFNLTDIAPETIGYIESVSYNMSSDVAEVKDKEGKTKVKCFYGHKREATISYISKGGSVKINDQIKIGDKNYNIVSFDETGSNQDWIKYSIKAVHYGKDTPIEPESNP